MIISLSAVFVLYSLLLLVVFIGLIKALRSKQTREEPHQMISVVIALRNEVANLEQLMSGLSLQTYPVESFEVILVDDHSTDGSFEWLRSASLKPHFSIHQLRDGTGKKKALAKGIAMARGSIIVTTDADCVHSPGWLQTINEGIGEHVNLLIGPVCIKGSEGIFSELQSLEFSSLVATAASTAALGSPILCNGANLAFRKRAFEEVKGYSGNEQIPSGDDEFLMRKIDKAYPRTIRFLNNPDGIVYTAPQETLKNFFDQRVRWAGKWKFNNYFTQCVAVIILTVQLSSLGIAFLYLGGVLSSVLVAALLLPKLLLEALILWKICLFLKINWSWLHFLLMQFIYPLYVIWVGFRSLWGTYEWKGRSLVHSMQRNP